MSETIERVRRLRRLERGLVEWAVQICLDMYREAFEELRDV